jgi:hypothetical protein
MQTHENAAVKMRRGEIEKQNRYLLERQRQFRIAADVVAEAWVGFAEVEAIAVIGSVAKILWKEVPRFREFRRAGIEVWHECKDLDLALWLASRDRLGELRRALAHALLQAYRTGRGISFVPHEIDVFLFAPISNEYLGRLCRFNQCPKGKVDCAAPGCGEIPFNKVIDGFSPRDDLLAGAEQAMLYRKGAGRLRSALDLPMAG